MQTVPTGVLHERSMVQALCVYEIGPSTVECQDQFPFVVVDQAPARRTVRVLSFVARAPQDGRWVNRAQ